MFTANLIVLSYHKFVNEPCDYPFSRTYEQFKIDLKTMEFDWISIDDSMESIIEACEICMIRNIRVKIFTCTSLIDTEGYCSWDQLRYLALFHDICNHSHTHVDLTTLTDEDIDWNIRTANRMIENEIGKRPRYFCPPFNQYNDTIERIANGFKLQLVKGRDTIKNTT